MAQTVRQRVQELERAAIGTRPPETRVVSLIDDGGEPLGAEAARARLAAARAEAGPDAVLMVVMYDDQEMPGDEEAHDGDTT